MNHGEAILMSASIQPHHLTPVTRTEKLAHMLEARKKVFMEILKEQIPANSR